MSYVYLRSEPGLWTVGHYSPKGDWYAASDHNDETKAANEVVRLNGGKVESPLEKAAPELLAALVTSEQRIVDLCDTVNFLHKQTGGNGRKVRADDYADKARDAISKANGG